MTTQPSFEQQVLQGVEFILPEPVLPSKTIPICETNAAFKPACEKLVEDTRNHLTEITLHMALLRLQENFFSCLRMAPKTCRKHMFSDKIICLMTTYHESFMQLHEMRLEIDPIRFREEIPPPAPITNVYRYEGFALGQTIDLNEAEAS